MTQQATQNQAKVRVTVGEVCVHVDVIGDPRVVIWVSSLLTFAFVVWCMTQS